MLSIGSISQIGVKIAGGNQRIAHKAACTAAVRVQVNTVTTAGVYRALGVDNSWDFKQFKWVQVTCPSCPPCRLCLNGIFHTLTAVSLQSPHVSLHIARPQRRLVRILGA